MNEIIRELKETASIVSLLEHLGYRPVPKKGRELMYHSMLREDDKSPSFSVNDQVGVWFDHGIGKGGNIIDFGMAYWKGLPFADVVNKLRDTLNAAPQAQKIIRPVRTARTPNYIIHQTKRIGTHPAITDYLIGRGIYPEARRYLKEVYYYVEDGNGDRKSYFAAGWKNENGAWEVRNRLFKGCMGPKAVSFLPDHPKKVAIFEGYFDFLSWKKEFPDHDHSVIVLNSVTLWEQGVSKAKAFSSIDLYFDRDPAGFRTASNFIAALPYATDRSGIYDGYNDYNEKIKAFTTGGPDQVIDTRKSHSPKR